jgi:hypothetical protein
MGDEKWHHIQIPSRAEMIDLKRRRNPERQWKIIATPSQDETNHCPKEGCS